MWAFLLQVQLPTVTTGPRINLAVSDLVMVVAVLISFGSIRLRDGAWSGWHLALPILLALNVTFVGVINNYTIFNKVAGLVVLLISYGFITSSVRSWNDIILVIRWFFFGMVLLSAVSIATYHLGVQIPRTFCQVCDVRLLGFMPDANLYGSLVVVALAAFIALEGSTVTLAPGILRWPSAVILIYALLLSSSRSAWIAFGVALIAAFLLGRGKTLFVLAIGAATVGVIGLLASEEQTAEFAKLSGRTHSIDSRWVLMEVGVNEFLENPLAGAGLGETPERAGQIIHNTPLWFAAELGVIGLVVFFGFLGWIVLRLVGAYVEASKAHRPVVAFLVMGNVAMFVFALPVEAFYQRHWWLLFALTVSASLIPGDEELGPTPEFSTLNVR